MHSHITSCNQTYKNKRYKSNYMQTVSKLRKKLHIKILYYNNNYYKKWAYDNDKYIFRDLLKY